MKSFIHNNINVAKVNVIDPAKDNFTQPLSIKEILDELLMKLLWIIIIEPYSYQKMKI